MHATERTGTPLDTMAARSPGQAGTAPGGTRSPTRLLQEAAPLISALLTGLLLSGSGAARAAELSGEVQGLLPAGLYRVTGDLVVPVGGTLILTPGVILEFEAGLWSEFELDARGTLLAEGTAEAPIVFRPAAGVDEFNYIRVADGGSRLRHCRIERAGHVEGMNQGGLWIDDCCPAVDDCDIVDARWNGFLVTGSLARPALSRVRVTGSTGSGILVDAGAGLDLVNGVSSGNGGDGLQLCGGPGTLVGCLFAGNGGHGVAGGGSEGAAATVVNCTVARNGEPDLAESDRLALYNCLVTSTPGTWADAEHTYATAREGWLGFVDADAGDYRLAGSAPGRDAGTRFGVPGLLLPDTDLDGNPRIHGIVDLGAFESTLDPDTGESGPFFSPALLRPRMTLPEFGIPGTGLPVMVAALGTYPLSAVTVELLPEGGTPFPLTVCSIAARDLIAGSDLAVQLYPIGIERVQEIIAGVPAGAPEGLHGIRVRLGDRAFESPQAVRVHSAWPQRWGLLHCTDLHVGATGESHTAAERLRAFVREANFLQPELVVMTGDLCENADVENAWDDSLLTILRGLTVPMFALPGNHERYNEDQTYNPLGYFRHFHNVNRFANSEVMVGGARIYGLDSGPELGALELARCLGPTTSALDWVEARLAGLDSETDRPRILLTHGPTYDYFSWSAQNTDRVRDLAATHGLALCLAGHTHRFETYRNEGTNWLGRNDYADEDDWGEDVPLPVFPLHVQTSSLGKGVHLPLPAAPSQAEGKVSAVPSDPARTEPMHAAAGDSRALRRGLFGDDIAYRWIQIEGTDVTFFSADSDGDGWRSTEDAWLLGEFDFSVTTEANGTITSRVTNHHHETWWRPHHFIPAIWGVPYLVSGGVCVHRYPDGILEAEVEMVGPGETSVVTLTPNHPANMASVESDGTGLRVLGNPFVGSAQFLVSEQHPRSVGPTPVIRLMVFDPAGRCIRQLSAAPGSVGSAADGSGPYAGPSGRGTESRRFTWNGRDDSGREVPPGVYFARREDQPHSAAIRVVKLR